MLEFNTVLTILLGWLLGLLTPGIADRIRRPYRRRDLMRAVVDEMLGLQYIMALLAYEIRSRHARLSDAFLNEILPIFEAYNGPDRIEGMVTVIKEARLLSEEKRKAAYQAIGKPAAAMSLRQYSIPLLATQIADLSICSVELQRSVLNVRYHLDLYNQVASYTQSQYEMSFSNPGPHDRAALVTNHENGTIDAGKRAETILHAIADLRNRYGSGMPMRLT